MTEQTATKAVRYVGYNPETGETSYAVPAKWGRAIPEPNARLIATAPDLYRLAQRILALDFHEDETTGALRDPDLLGKIAEIQGSAAACVQKADER